MAALQALERAAPGRHRVLVVDDDSPDGTGDIADRLAERHEAVEVLHRTAREGLGPAYLAGFGVACAAARRTSWRWTPTSRRPGATSRGSWRRARTPTSPWGPGTRPAARSTTGARCAGSSAARGCLYAQRVLGVEVRDLTGGFKCFRREVLEAIDLAHARSHGYVFQIELTYRALQAGFRVREVPITFRDRIEGRSKMSWAIALEAMLLVPRLRFGRRGRALGAQMRALSDMR